MIASPYLDAIRCPRSLIRTSLLCCKISDACKMAPRIVLVVRTIVGAKVDKLFLLEASRTRTKTFALTITNKD